MGPDFIAKLLPDVCKLIFASGEKSSAAQFWQIVTTLWSEYWLWILIGLVVWVIFEIFTRHGTAHYNSKNGFSPTFNRVIGSGIYLLFQSITYFVLTFIFGAGIYCTPVPYVIHPTIFFLTWLFLFKIKFWVY